MTSGKIIRCFEIVAGELKLRSPRDYSSDARFRKGEEPLVCLESVFLVTHVRVDLSRGEARVLSA